MENDRTESLSITFHSGDNLPKALKAAKLKLANIVYPPGEDWAGSSIEWTPAQWSVLGCDTAGQALTHAGAVVRKGLLNGMDVSIGGIGSVMTHPEARRRGYAASAIERAISFFHEQDIDFALLVCDQKLIPLYGRLGFSQFEGELFVLQRGSRERFTFNLPMVRPVSSEISNTGEIDLLGPPW